MLAQPAARHARLDVLWLVALPLVARTCLKEVLEQVVLEGPFAHLVEIRLNLSAQIVALDSLAHVLVLWAVTKVHGYNVDVLLVLEPLYPLVLLLLALGVDLVLVVLKVVELCQATDEVFFVDVDGITCLGVVGASVDCAGGEGGTGADGGDADGGSGGDGVSGGWLCVGCCGRHVLLATVVILHKTLSRSDSFGWRITRAAPTLVGSGIFPLGCTFALGGRELIEKVLAQPFRKLPPAVRLAAVNAQFGAQRLEGLTARPNALQTLNELVLGGGT